jgi:non-heme chloroperoxidase
MTDDQMLLAQVPNHATLKVHQGYPYGILTVHADLLNADILTFIQD